MTEITAITTAQHERGETLIRIETDAGVVGYGEAGATGPTTRANVEQLADVLIGADPLAIDRHYDRMMGKQHSKRAHVPTVSGIDIALWDLAGKLLDRPICDLLLGRYRDAVPYYINSGPADLLDPDACADWAAELAADPEAPPTVKVTFDAALAAGDPYPPQPRSIRRESRTLSGPAFERLEEAATNVRTALGPDRDFIAHGHNEWDVPSATGYAEAVAPADPLWLEDPLPIEFAESWVTLKQEAPCRILTGEKLEGVAEFAPFIDRSAVHVVQPDVAYAGGITGCRRIARRADEQHLAVTAHNTGSLVQTLATVQFGAATRNFWLTETVITHDPWTREIGHAPGFSIQDGTLSVPDGPGLGLEAIDADVLDDHLAPGEQRWT